MSNGEHEIRTPKGLRIGNRSVVDGKNIGEIRMLVQLVREGDLPLERAAAKAKMTVEQFKETMENTPLQAV